MGRWSRLVAEEFVTWLDVGPGLTWVDIGCGTGALGQTVLGRAAPGRLISIDRSLGFLTAARSRAAKGSGQYLVADAQELPAAAAAVDVAVSGLMLNFVSEPARMLAEMVRVIAHGGLVGVYVWDYAGRMEFLRHFWDAVTEFQPDAAELDEGRRFPLCTSEALRDLFVARGVTQTEVRPIDVSTDFRGFDDFWSPFLGGQGPAPGYVAQLSSEGRDRLRELVRQRVPHRADGSIALVARAWAVRGRKAARTAE